MDDTLSNVAVREVGMAAVHVTGAPRQLAKAEQLAEVERSIGLCSSACGRRAEQTDG